jgi:hypothetical protein
MNKPLVSPRSILDKAKLESMSDKDYEVYNRIERRVNSRVKARLLATLSQYRADAANMTPLDIIREKHDSKTLGNYLRVDGHPRPAARWDAHHIISGDHPDAAQSRTILAEILMRIDDPDNGCWMPKTKADARPSIYPNAIGHNRIHRERYYHWIDNNLAALTTLGQVKAFLITVRAQLLQGNIKPEMKLQQDIDEVEYKHWLKKTRK